MVSQEWAVLLKKERHCNSASLNYLKRNQPRRHGKTLIGTAEHNFSTELRFRTYSKVSRTSENCYCSSFHLPSWSSCTTSIPHCPSVLEDPASCLLRAWSKLFPSPRSPVLHPSLHYFTQLPSAPLSDLSSKVNSPGKSASDPIPNMLPTLPNLFIHCYIIY